MAEDNIRASMFRCNLNKEEDRRAWEIFENVDKKKFKSSNDFLKKAIIAYDKQLNTQPKQLTEDRLLEVIDNAIKTGIQKQMEDMQLEKIEVPEITETKEEKKEEQDVQIPDECLDFLKGLDDM